MNAKIYKQCCAEFIGTFALVFMGCGAIILHQTIVNGLHTLGIPLVFGGIISVMIYALGHISGAHFNPAVTIAFAAARHFPLKKVFAYIPAQILGAIMASLLHRWIFGIENHQFGTSINNLAILPGFVLEVIFTFFLMLVIISVATDTSAVGEMAGLAIGTTVAIAALAGGTLTGASMNPARSLGPAIISGNLEQIWLYLLAPVFGAICGALVYENIRLK